MARLVALALLLTLACAQCPPRTVINATAAPSGSFASNAAGAAEYIPNWTCEWLISGNRLHNAPSITLTHRQHRRALPSSSRSRRTLQSAIGTT